MNGQTARSRKAAHPPPPPPPCSVLCLALEMHLGLSCRSLRLLPPLKINLQANLDIQGSQIAHNHHLSPRTDDEPASRGDYGLAPQPVGNFFLPDFSWRPESKRKVVITLKNASGVIGIGPEAAESHCKEAGCHICASRAVMSGGRGGGGGNSSASASAKAWSESRCTRGSLLSRAPSLCCFPSGSSGVMTSQPRAVRFKTTHLCLL